MHVQSVRARTCLLVKKASYLDFLVWDDQDFARGWLCYLRRRLRLHRQLIYLFIILNSMGYAKRENR